MTVGNRVWALTAAAMAALAVIKAAVNATSSLDEHARAGDMIATWKPWTLEASSAVAWLSVMPLLALLAIRVKERLKLPALALLLVAATVPISLLHVGLMVALRHVAYGALGEGYRLAGDLLGGLVYEWRKDAVDCLMLAATFIAVDWLARREDAPRPAGGRIEVRDGSRTTFVDPGDIRWVEAAGNYIELHTASASLLHRATLSEMERLLAPHGMARIHRSRLVRRDAVRRVETRPSGDFDAWLDDATVVGGSRRYRDALVVR